MGNAESNWGIVIFGLMARLASWILYNIFQRVFGREFRERFLSNGGKQSNYAETLRKSGNAWSLLVCWKNVCDIFPSPLLLAICHVDHTQIHPCSQDYIWSGLCCLWFLAFVATFGQNDSETSKARKERKLSSKYNLFSPMEEKPLAMHKSGIYIWHENRVKINLCCL